MTQRFLRNLNDFATVCKNDLTEMRLKEQNLNHNFKDLQIGVKRSIVNTKPKITKPYESPLEMRRRLYPSEQPLPLPPIKKRQAQSDMALRPAPFPTRHYALKVQPCQAAKRFYRPMSLLQRQDEKLEQIEDYLNNPESTTYINGSIDQNLLIRAFNVNEFSSTILINP